MGRRAARRPEPQGARGAAQAARQTEVERRGGRIMMQPKHFLWRVEGKVGVVTLNRPEKKNPLTFESYAELRDLFLDLKNDSGTKAVVVAGSGGNFCSGGDVHEIIGPLTKMRMPQLLEFTRMTGDLVKAMRHCPQPVIAAIEGACAGAGALIGQGRAAELLYSGRALDAAEGQAWGFFNRIADPVLPAALETAKALASGPTFAHAMTKNMLHQEWNAGLDEAIEMEAQAQAVCMQTKDFHRAYEAFAARRTPVFEGD